MFRTIAQISNTLAWYWMLAAIMVMPVSMRSQTQSPEQTLKSILEVATIKPVKIPDANNTRDVKQGRRLFMYQATVKDLMAFAYGIDLTQVLDSPKWAADERYDVQAQAIEEVDIVTNDYWPEELLKEVLTDRFKLKFHREQRMLPVYVLSVAKGGSKLKVSDPNSSSNGGGGAHLGESFFRKTPIAQFSSWLSHSVLDRKVVDKTGISGDFDFDLKWSPDETQFARLGMVKSDTDSKGPNLFTAIREQLGLKLESAKAPIEVLVIDHIEKPSEN